MIERVKESLAHIEKHAEDARVSRVWSEPERGQIYEKYTFQIWRKACHGVDKTEEEVEYLSES